MAIHKGNELNNVRETWNRNEEQRARENAPASGNAGTVSDDLQQTISDEAAEYDRANKEDRVLGGDRATVSDEERENT
jgi:hypothetical protein